MRERERDREGGQRKHEEEVEDGEIAKNIRYHNFKDDTIINTQAHTRNHHKHTK